jgi:hypothetical protein
MHLTALVILVASLSPQEGVPADVAGPPPTELCGISDVYLDVSVIAYNRERPGGRGDGVAANRLRTLLKDILVGAGGLVIDRRVAGRVPELRVSVTIARSATRPEVASLNTRVAFADAVQLLRLPGVTPVNHAILWDASTTALVAEDELVSSMTTAATAGVQAFLRDLKTSESQGPAAWCKGRITTR